MKADCHTHTVNSPRGTHTASEMCAAAIENGVSVLALTDHCECNRFFPCEFYTENPNDFDSYDNRNLFGRSLSDIEKAKCEYGNRLTVLCGTELGQPTFDYEAAESVVSDSRLDVVIGSMHQIPNCDDFCGLSFTSAEAASKQLERYFSEILKMCRWGKFNVLGHLTYPLRYMEGKFGIKPDIAQFYDIIMQIMREIVSREIALEINCSGLRQAYGRTFPTADMVKLYKECGGSFVSIGSDTHTAEFIGSGFEIAADIALSCGIEQGVYYVGRKPQFYRLER